MESVLVLYNEKLDEVGIFNPFIQEQYWLGTPYLAWRSLEVCIEYGWTVVGVL